MAKGKSKKRVKKPVRKTARTGLLSSKLLVLIGAAVLAAVLYAIMSPSGAFRPGPVSSPNAAGKSGVAKPAARMESKPAARTETKPAVKAEPKSVAKAEPKPIVAKVEPKPPAPVVPEGPHCTGQPLSLFDVQTKVQNPSWIFVDVRSVEKFSAGSIPGSRNIPAGDFDIAFARESASLSQSSGIILYGDDFNDAAVQDVCTKMWGKNLPRIYLFREGWSRWPKAQ